MQNKRGISAIVATVMIILITVAAIGILWAAIIPMIQTSLDFSSLQGRVSVLEKGYTAYDSTKNIASVQVKRDVDEGVMDRIKITFEVNGNSYSSSVIAPPSGGTRVYTFNMTGIGEPDSVSVAPIFAVGNKEKEGEITSTVDIPKSRLSEIDVFIQEVGEEYFGDSSCLEILNSGGSTGDGVYTIDIDGKEGEDSFEVYCDMTTDKGGWTLLMKARGDDNVFEYSSDYWTTDNVLNENDLSTADTNAKYESFNFLLITNIRATWPDIDHTMKELVSSQTPLNLFSTVNSIFFEPNSGGCSDGFEYGDFADNFLSQGGYQRYGFNLDSSFGCGSQARVRWGWVWNNEASSCSSTDAMSGIGLYYAAGERAASMGSWNTCCDCQGVADGPSPQRVLIWGK
jgi:flagellin-like protein